MHFTYDPEANAAYLSLTEQPRFLQVQISGISTAGMKGEIEIDLDQEGRVIGIEFVHASFILPKDLLNKY